MGMSWNTILKEESVKPYYKQLMNFVQAEYACREIYPEWELIFSSLRKTPFDKVKVVILGQDPYINKGQANGLCFSVKKGSRIPPSLRNVFKELQNDVGCEIPYHGDLTKWTEQGVLLLNLILTVRSGTSNSHRNKGWEIFTGRVLHELNTCNRPLVFFLWGNQAQAAGRYLDRDKHLVIETAHPSPHSASMGFYGSRPFSKANQFLASKGYTPINWCL